MASNNDVQIPPGTAQTGKPPIAWRKDLRDKWETLKKPEMEKNIRDVTGVQYVIQVDTNGIWTYCQSGWSTSSPGGMLADIFQGVWTGLRTFKDQHGQEGVNDFNKTVTNHLITLEPSTDIPYGGCDIKDGRLRVLFNPNVNFAGADRALGDLSKALSQASASGAGGAVLPFETTANIRERYEGPIADILKKMKESLNSDKITFVPNFEENFAAVLAFEQQNPDEAKQSLNRTWKQTFGRDSYDYFRALQLAVDRHGVGKDDMLLEAFNEGVESGVIVLRVIPNTKAQYCETVIEDGKLYMQCKPKWWVMNNDHIGDELISSL